MGARHSDEIARIQAAYARRTRNYDPLDPWVSLVRQERERAYLRWATRSGIAPFADRRLVEIGCGNGTNLLEFMRLGFRPENLFGNELLPQRLDAASHLLPAAVRLLSGDASALDLPDNSFDVVFQSMVMSSILDEGLQRDVARRMWDLARPGGGVLWYDFTYDNPANPDVRGIKMRRIRQLFPEAGIASWRVTLAPPVARRLVAVHRGLYPIVNMIPWLRTHLLCWLAKDSDGRNGDQGSGARG